MDSAGRLYFAQARRYDAGAGRFVSEDFFRGLAVAPYTQNHYNYCWNRPLDLVDLNGMIPTAGVTNDLFDMGAGDNGKGKTLDIPDDWLVPNKTNNLEIPDEIVLDLEGLKSDSTKSTANLEFSDELQLDFNKYKQDWQKSTTNSESEKCTVVGILGLSGAIGDGAYLNGSIQLVVDGTGNVALQVSVGTGVEAGASGKVSVILGGYYAPSLYSVQGFGLEEGGTAGEVLVGGAGAWQACDENENPLYYGGYLSLGLGGEATFVSAHTSMSNTWTLCSGNVVEWWNGLWENNKEGCLE